MIPYEELDRALARWKARTQGGSVDGAQDVSVESAAIVQSVPRHGEERGSVPQRISSGFGESTGELDLDNEEVVETLDD
jgi:hypothetical protein